MRCPRGQTLAKSIDCQLDPNFVIIDQRTEVNDSGREPSDQPRRYVSRSYVHLRRHFARLSQGVKDELRRWASSKEPRDRRGLNDPYTEVPVDHSRDGRAHVVGVGNGDANRLA